ncbi:MAG: radical SAM protein [Elusimicrobiota bacterium]|jgi:uncharacterized protein
MSDYFISRYLNVINLGETALLFNGTNGCLDEVSKELGDILRRGNANLDFLSTDDLLFLRKRGHLTPFPPDEERRRFREFADALHRKKSSARRLRGGLMLLMSYNCNLACKYCYQQQHRPAKSRAVMDENLVAELFEKHLASMFPGVPMENIDISFYGGEPFLPSNEKTIRKALEYAARYKMSSSAITNATQVDVMADIFGEGPGKVNRVQVSLDGNRAAHDASRVPSSGTGTFDKIIANIRLLLDKGAQVSVRLNLDRNSLPTVPALLQYLKEQGIAGHPRATVYGNPLHDGIARVDDTDFVDLTDLSAKMLGMGVDLEHPVSLKANDMKYLYNLEKGLGLSTTCFCMQTTQNALIVDPFKDIYACFEEAGYPEFRMGSIGEGGVEFFPLRETYMKRHVANMEDCTACSVALACGGQCGVRCRMKTGDLFKPHCADFKEVVLNAVKHAYLKRQKQTDSCAASIREAAAT